LELQGRQASKENIDKAIQSIQAATEGGSVGKFSTRKRRPLIYVEHKKERPQSFHQQTDNKQPFLGSDMVRTSDGGWRSKTFAEQARDRDRAVEQAKTTTSRPSKGVSAWQTFCEGLRNSANSHGRNAQLEELYNLGFSGQLEWKDVYSQMSSMKRAFEAPRQTAPY
jgi:hypothetical protein